MNRLLGSIAIAVLSSSILANESYTLDVNHTLPLFEVNHFGFSTQRGRFDKTTGKIWLDQVSKTGRVELDIDANSINMGQSKWNDHMKSEDFFNTARFPTISFRSEHLIFDGEKPVAAEGSLTLLGVSKPLRIKINHFTCGTNPLNQKQLCAADVEATLKRSEFGMTKYLPAVGDDIKALVPVEAYKD